MFFGLQHCNTVPKEADKPPPRKHHGHAYAPLQLQGLLFQAPRSPYWRYFQKVQLLPVVDGLPEFQLFLFHPRAANVVPELCVFGLQCAA